MKHKPIFLLAVIVLFAACGQSYEEKVRLSRAERARLAQEEAAALKVAVLPTLDCMPVYLAKQKHWYDSTQVDVRLKVRNAQIDCDTALKGKSVEVAVTDLKRVENMAKHGVKLSAMGQTNAYWQLIANRTARVRTAAQLGDKMVAMTRYSATDYLTDRVLEGVKTSAPVFRVQINDVLIRLDMLKNNEMDAMWLTEPQATEARMYKHTVIEDSRKLKENLGVVVTGTHLLKDRKRVKQLTAFVEGYNRACDSLNHYGVKHYADLVKVVCHTDDKTIDRLPKLSYPHIALPKQQ